MKRIRGRERLNLFNGNFFKITKHLDKKNIEARCQLCLPTINDIKGNYSITSNFLVHLKRKHPGAIEKYREYKRSNGIEGSFNGVTDERQLRNIQVESNKMSFSNKAYYKKSREGQGNFSRSIKGTSIPFEIENKLTKTALFDGKFYKISQFMNGRRNIVARCQLCSPNITNVKGSCLTTSNFLTHLKRKHQGSIEQYHEYKRQKKKANAYAPEPELESKSSLLPPDLGILQNPQFLEEHNVKEENVAIEDGVEMVSLHENLQDFIFKSNLIMLQDQSSTNDICQIIPQQQEETNLSEPDWKTKLTEILITTNNHALDEKHNNILATGATANKEMYLEESQLSQKISLSQVEFDNKLFKFVVDTMTPLAVIEHDSFRNLFQGMNDAVVINKDVIAMKINEEFQNKKEKIKNDLRNVSYLCRTLDTYSVDGYRLLVVTCYWIDKKFKRQSTLLGCKKINDKDSRKITEFLQLINDQFGIDDCNIVATVTFNVWNYLKPILDQFGIELSECNGTDTIDKDNENISILEFNNHPPIIFNHFQSASHTFNLIGTTEIVNIINKEVSLHLNHKNVLKKCSILWRKSKIRDYAEIMENILGYKLNYPKFNSWKSLYDCMKQIYDSKKNICKVLEIFQETEFKESEFIHIQEYLKFLKPLADTFDFLDNDENSYFGYLLPSILSLRVKYEKLQNTLDFKFFDFSVRDIIQVIETRFSHLFSINNNSEEAIIAAVCIPCIKMRWLKVFNEKDSTADSNKICQIIINAASKLPIPNNINSCMKSEDVDMDFFDFKETESTNNLSLKERITSELSKYLQDPRRDICLLEEYTIMKELFYKYNTCISSNAAMERLISYDNIVGSPNISTISNSLLEKCALLKAAI